MGPEACTLLLPFASELLLVSSCLWICKRLSSHRLQLCQALM